MKKKTCLIIGGGLGLGVALAKRFGAEQFKVAILNRNPEVLQVVSKEMEDLEIEFMPLVGNISDFRVLADSINSFVQEVGAPDVLIYNAAAFGSGDALVQEPEKFVEDFRVSVAGFILCYQLLFKGMSMLEGSILVTGGGIAYRPSFEYLSLGLGKTSLDYVVQSIGPFFSNNKIHVSSLMVNGKIEEGSYFSPDNIALAFWKMYLGRNMNRYRVDYSL